MNRKERLSEFNRSNILASAKELFSDKGIEQTTMDDIAHHADYSKSTIYVYFKSKDEILNNIILEHFIILKNMIAEALIGDNSFPRGYYAVCDALVQFYDAYPLYFDSIIGEIKIPKDESESVLVRIYEVGEEINGIMERYFSKCISENTVSFNVPPIQATFTLWAGLSGIISMANKKEAYINKAMGISKEVFIKNSFDLLLKSISYKGDATQ